MELFSCGVSHNITGFAKHKHNCFEIVITTSGFGETVIGELEIPVFADSVVVIPPGVSHEHRSNSMFSDMFVQLADVQLPNEVFHFKDTTCEICNLVKMIYTNYIKKENNYRAILQYLTGAFYEYLVKYTGNKFKYGFVFELKNTLVNNLANSEFNISDAVKCIGVSYEYMRHCFKEETGYTPLEYLTMIRVRQAKEYLITSKFYSVSDVAFLCGFSDTYYFSRCFKKHTGISPAGYRKTNI